MSNSEIITFSWLKMSSLRKTFVIRSEDQIKLLGLFIRANWKQMDEAGGPLMCELSEYKSKRSREQNAYYWALLEAIEQQAYRNGRQYDKEVWHEFFKREFIGLEDMPKGPPMAKSSAKLTVAEFAVYIEQIHAFATQELQVTFYAPEWKDIAQTKKHIAQIAQCDMVPLLTSVGETND